MENAKYMLLRSLMAGHPASTTAPAYHVHLAELVSMGLVTTTGELTPAGLEAVRNQDSHLPQRPRASAVKWRRRHYDLRAEYSGRTGFTGNRARRAGGVA
jgi:hypothetical protein